MNSSRKYHFKQVAWFLLFAALVFAGDRLIAWAFHKQVNKSMFRYSRMYRGEGDADILIVGNSRGLIFYQPYMEQVTGQKTFSICYYSMPCEIATALGKDYIDRYPNVKKVVIELSVVEMSDDKLLPAFTTYMPFSPRIDSVVENKSKETWDISRVFHIYRYNNEVFQRVLYYNNRLDNDWYFDRTINERLIKEVHQRKLSFKVPDKHVEDIRQLVDYCKLKNKEVVLVIGPFFPGYEVKNLDLLARKVSQATGLPVHDYSRNVNDYSAFSDYLHANIKGGCALIDLMVKDGLLPNHATAKPAQEISALQP